MRATLVVAATTHPSDGEGVLTLLGYRCDDMSQLCSPHSLYSQDAIVC